MRNSALPSGSSKVFEGFQSHRLYWVYTLIIALNFCQTEIFPEQKVSNVFVVLISTEGALRLPMTQRPKNGVAGWHCHPESFCTSGKILRVTLNIALGSSGTL